MRGKSILFGRSRALRVVCALACAPVFALACLWPAEAQEAKAKPFEANWESLKTYTVPEWYEDAKFGIFIHWGVYSVPAFTNEWYPRNMYKQDQAEFKHHVDTYGPQSKFGYKDFIPQFTAEKFDANEWARLFKEAGARYVVPVAEHHDGFAMYDCQRSEWCAAKMGPKRDIIGELAKAVRENGMVFGVSSHRAEHWWFFSEGMKFDSDVKSGQWNSLYGPAQPDNVQPDQAFLDDWYARTCELVDKYQPQLVWFDWWIEQPAFAPYLQRFAAYYYNRGLEWNRGVAINYKNQSFPDEAAVLDIERGKLDATRTRLWQTDTSISIRSWGYITGDIFRTADSLVDDLIDIVSKNGCLLLNIGPKPDGTIPDPAKERLLAIGAWLKQNGEAIYGTRPWRVFGEGPTEVLSGTFTDAKNKAFTPEDIRFTCHGDTLYAIALAKPAKELVIRSLNDKDAADAKVKDVRLLATGEALKWQRSEKGLAIELPKDVPGDYAFVFKIALDR